MIYIQYGTINADNAPRQYLWQIDNYFDAYFEDIWMQDGWAKKVLETIDKSKLVAPKIIDSPVFGVVPYQWISGGSKLLILMNMVQDIVYDGDNLGDNCWPLLLELGKTKDIMISLSYFPEFKWVDGGEVTILETGEVINNHYDFVTSHMHSKYKYSELEFSDIKWPKYINYERFKPEIDEDDLEFIDEDGE